MQHDDETLEMPSNDASNSSGSALSRRLLEVFARPPTEEELQVARQQIAEEARRPRQPLPTGGVIWVAPRQQPPTTSLQPQESIQELSRRLGLNMAPSDHPSYQEGPLVILGAPPQEPQTEPLPPSAEPPTP